MRRVLCQPNGDLCYCTGSPPHPQHDIFKVSAAERERVLAGLRVYTAPITLAHIEREIESTRRSERDTKTNLSALLYAQSVGDAP